MELITVRIEEAHASHYPISLPVSRQVENQAMNLIRILEFQNLRTFLTLLTNRGQF